MDEIQKDGQPHSRQLPEEEGYVERPKWQVWGARIGLVVFVVFVILQILGIARGGL